MAVENESARAILSDLLRQYGLTSLTDWAFQRLGNSTDPMIVEQELFQRDEFKRRFPSYWERINRGLPAKSPQEIMQYESNARGLFRAAGIPETFYDQPDEIARLIVADVGFNELQSRVANAYNRVAQAPVEVRQTFSEYYGGSDPDGALVALALDPEMAEQKVIQRAAAAEAGGLARQVAGISVMRPFAERLAEAGISSGELRQGFDQLRQQSRLYEASVSEQNDMSAATTGVEATFGLSADAANRVAQRRSQRLARANATGGFAASEQGLVGLGEAR